MDREIINRFNDTILETALERFGIKKENINRLDGFESFIFNVKRDDKEFILKISYGKRRTKEMILGEIDFINYLNSKGLTVPSANLSLNNIYVEVIPCEDIYFTAVLYDKAPGGRVKKEQCNETLYYNMGRYLGKIHHLSKSYKPQNILRPNIFDESVPELDKLIPKEQKKIRRRAEELIEYFKALPSNNKSYGLIHVDFHYGNFFIHNNEIYLFDFDDCQYSFFIHDIAMAFFYTLPHNCVENEQINDGYKFLNSFLKGYFEENDLDKKWLNEIPYFLKLREFELYAVFNGMMDIYGENIWISNFMKDRKEKIENNVPYFDLDVNNIFGSK